MFHGGQDLLYRASDAGSGPILPHGLFKLTGAFMMEYMPINPISLSSRHIATDPPMAMTGIPFRAACLRLLRLSFLLLSGRLSVPRP